MITEYDYGVNFINHYHFTVYHLCALLVYYHLIGIHSLFCRSADDDSPVTKITVIIPARNEAENMALYSLNSGPKLSWATCLTIIVVDDHSR